MKLSKTKIFFLSITVVVLALGMLAFTPFDGLSIAGTDDDRPTPIADHQQALADALGIPVEDLQAAYTAAAQTALEQSVNDALEKGLITQERADAMLSGEGRFGRHAHFGPGFAGTDMDELVAAELGISVEEFQTAQNEVFSVMIEQAVADGQMTQTAADLALARQAAGSYLEEAWSSAYQDAVQNALGDGAIDQTQADLLLDNMGGFRGGFNRMPFGGRGGHNHPLPEPSE